MPPSTKPIPVGSKQRTIAVLGPGRCGTSTIARGLISLGIDFGDRLKPAARKNPRGFFEDLDLLSINYEVHARLGLRRNGSSVGWIPAARWNSPEIPPITVQAQKVVRLKFGQTPLWGCKIGGMMRVLPFWEHVLEDDSRDIAYVLAIRHPASVARSRARLDPYRSIPEKSDLEFAAQILPFAARMLRRPVVVVDYDRVMADPAGAMRRIAERLLLPLSAEIEREIATYASAFIRNAYRHNLATDDGGAVTPLTWRLYRCLLALADDSRSVDDPQVTAELTGLTDDFRSMASTLRLVDELEERLRRRGPTLRSVFFAAYSHLPTRTTLKDVIALSLTGPAQRKSRQQRHADWP